MSMQDTIRKRYPITFSIRDPENIHMIPQCIDDGMYYIKAPRDIYLATKETEDVETGIIFGLPSQFVVLFENSELVLTPHLHIESIYDVLMTKGLEVVAPRILSASFSPSELRLFLRNISDKHAIVKAGEPIACAYVTMTLPVMLGTKFK